METKQIYGYPDPLASSKEKDKPEYGLKYAKFISGHWFNGGLSSDDQCSYQERRNWIREQRLYAKGRQDEKIYKDVVSKETEDLTFMNLDWRPINLMGKFVNVVANGIQEDNYTIGVSALSTHAGVEKEKLQRDLKKKMYSKKYLEKVKNVLGIDMTPQGMVPENMEDLNMMVNVKHRSKCEIGEEIALNYVFKTNNWHNVKEKVDEDLTVAGIGIVKVETDQRNGILLKYIDPEFFIHSYVRDKHFKDMKYCGHIEPTTIGDLRRNSGFSDGKLREIAKRYSSSQAQSVFGIDYHTCPMSELLNMKVEVLHFCFETSKTFVYQKKKTKYGDFYTEKDESYKAKKKSRSKRIDNTYNTWYEGCYVIGTDYIYDYKEVENMLVDETDKAMCDYVVRASDLYENKLSSFVDDTRPLLDQMHYTLLKLQQLIVQTRPNGVNIDIDMLAELEGKTKGSKMTWQEILGMFNAKGIVFSSRANMGDDGLKDRAAITEIPNGVSQKLPFLLEVLRDQYQRVRDITGINPFRDGSQSEDSLVGVQQLAFMQSNVATANIVNASLDITKTTAERISARITDIFKNSRLKETYIAAVGQENMDIAKALKDRHLHDFGFHIQLKPIEAEINKLTEDLSLCLQEGSITVDIKMEAEEYAKINIKTAREYLKYARKKYAEEKLKEEAIRSRTKAENDMMSNRSAEEAKVMAEAERAKIRVWEKKEEAKIEVIKQQQLNMVNKPKEEREYMIDLEKEYIRAQSAMGKTKYIEEQKLDRQNKNNTDHSKMIEQRRNDSGSIDFENRNQGFRELIESLR